MEGKIKIETSNKIIDYNIKDLEEDIMVDPPRICIEEIMNVMRPIMRELYFLNQCVLNPEIILDDETGKSFVKYDIGYLRYDSFCLRNTLTILKVLTRCQ